MEDAVHRRCRRRVDVVEVEPRRRRRPPRRVVPRLARPARPASAAAGAASSSGARPGRGPRTASGRRGQVEHVLHRRRLGVVLPERRRGRGAARWCGARSASCTACARPRRAPHVAAGEAARSVRCASTWSAPFCASSSTTDDDGALPERAPRQLLDEPPERPVVVGHLRVGRVHAVHRLREDAEVIVREAHDRERRQLPRRHEPVELALPLLVTPVVGEASCRSRGSTGRSRARARRASGTRPASAVSKGMRASGTLRRIARGQAVARSRSQKTP